MFKRDFRRLNDNDLEEINSNNPKIHHHESVDVSEPTSAPKKVDDEKFEILDARDVLENEIKKMEKKLEEGDLDADERKRMEESIEELKEEMSDLDEQLLSLDIQMGIDNTKKILDEVKAKQEEDEDIEITVKDGAELVGSEEELEAADPETVEALKVARSWLETPDEIVSDGADAIVGHNRLKSVFRTHVVAPTKLPELFKNDDPPNRTFMLVGPPGTGKTDAVKGYAKDLGFNFIEVKGSQVMSTYVGKAEKHTAALFDVALENEPCIIFIDEADALLGNRTSIGNEKTRKITDEFLTAISKLRKLNRDVYIAGATNHPEALDPAAMRRFVRIPVGMPGTKEREQIWRAKILSSGIKSDEIDYEKLARMTEGYSGSDIDMLAREVKSRPKEDAFEGLSIKDFDYVDIDKDDLRPITMDDFEDVISHNPPSVSQEEIEKIEAWFDSFD